MTLSRATVALGSNLGDRLAQLRKGVAGMRALGRVASVSSLYETEPVGGPVQGRYLNAVVVLETELPPDELLAELHRIEGNSARIREVHWGPRTLDLDLVTFDDQVLARPELAVPHPRAHERRFVLAPLLEVAPDVRLADGSLPSEAIARVQNQEIHRWPGSWVDEDPGLGREATWWVVGQFTLLAGWALAVVLTRRSTSAPSLVSGGLLTLLGLVLGVGAVRAFGTTITPSPQPAKDTRLVDRGVYRLVRHPMYGAVLLSTLGLAIAAHAIGGVLVWAVLAGFLRVKSGREERILAIVVPGYDRYRMAVHRRFFPGLW